MADIRSQAVKLMAEEIIRAINKITDDNNRGYVNTQIANHGGSGGGSGGGGVYPGTIPASQVSGLTTAIANYIYGAPQQAAEGDVDAGRVISTLNGLSALVVQSATIDTAQIENLYSSYGEFINLVAEKAELEEVDTEELYAQFAEMGLSNIGTANIGFGQIKDLVAGTAIIRQGVGGELYIDTLAVTDANMVSLTTGELMLKNSDGQFVRIVVDSDTGEVSGEPVTFDGDDVFNNNSLSGGKIIENTITARQLNVSQIFADSALVGAIKANNIDVNDLFANTTFTNKITSPAVGSNIDISSNASILLTQGRIDLLIDGSSSTTQLVITDGLIRAIGNKFSVIADTIDLSNNTTIAKQVKIQNTAPTSPAVNDLWLDISLNPPVLKQYTSSGWVIVNDTSGLEDEFTEIIENLEFRIDSQDGSITSIADRVTTVEDTALDLTTRVQTAESKITPSAIVQTVRDSTDYQSDLSELEMTAQKFETFVGNSSGISQISQTASKINLVVGSGSAVGSLSLTQDMLNAIANKVTLIAQDPTSTLSTQFTLTPAKLETIIQNSGDTSTIKQAINKINFAVTEDENTGELTITPEAIDIIADNITIDGSKIDISANQSITLIAGKADSASSVASAAQTAANSASAAASAAQSTANSASTAASNAQTAADSANSKIDNLSIGGRNLIVDSSVYRENSSLTLTTALKDGLVNDQYLYMPCTPGETYTFQCKTDGVWGTHNTGGTGGGCTHLFLYLQTADEIGSYSRFKTAAALVNTEYIGKTGLGVWTYTIPTDYAYERIRFRFDIHSDGTTPYTVSWWDIKAEKGNRATDWTPPPEDVDDAIGGAQESAEAAQNRADEAYDALETRVRVDADGLHVGKNDDLADRQNEILIRTGSNPTIDFMFDGTAESSIAKDYHRFGNMEIRVPRVGGFVFQAVEGG